MRWEMSKCRRIYVVLVLMGQEKIVDIFWKSTWTHTCVSQNVRMKPRPKVRPLGKPRIGENPPASYLDKSAGLTKISYTQGILVSGLLKKKSDASPT
jgi:hypothetical protein